MVSGVPVQGDIIMISADPRRGHEQQGRRPYICLSNKLISDCANIAIFAPISGTARKYPLYIPLEGVGTTGAVLLDQLIAIDYNARSFRYVESVPERLISELLEKVVLIFQPNAPAREGAAARGS
ncbi:MAG: type II toxin-antitoxin system PemK/MazF family toxin [Clostridiales bacterium]|jgi:mRNA interferase MazF|nr:type II toxin-antitoxin system PemK/MazF family toxin [Clostridiales bacterium]